MHRAAPEKTSLRLEVICNLPLVRAADARCPDRGENQYVMRTTPRLGPDDPTVGQFHAAIRQQDAGSIIPDPAVIATRQADSALTILAASSSPSIGARVACRSSPRPSRIMSFIFWRERKAVLLRILSRIDGSSSCFP